MNSSIQNAGIPKDEIDLLIHLYSSGNFNEAIKKTKALNNLYPNVPIIFNIAGASYKALGNIDAMMDMSI